MRWQSKTQKARAGTRAKISTRLFEATNLKPLGVVTQFLLDVVVFFALEDSARHFAVGGEVFCERVVACLDSDKQRGSHHRGNRATNAERGAETAVSEASFIDFASLRRFASGATSGFFRRRTLRG